MRHLLLLFLQILCVTNGNLCAALHIYLGRCTCLQKLLTIIAANINNIHIPHLFCLTCCLRQCWAFDLAYFRDPRPRVSLPLLRLSLFDAVHQAGQSGCCSLDRNTSLVPSLVLWAPPSQRDFLPWWVGYS